MHIRKIVALISSCILLSACSPDFEAGERVLAFIQTDPLNKCRIIITSHFNQSMPPMSATIDGCELKEKRNANGGNQ